jgi:hypothetical protein
MGENESMAIIGAPSKASATLTQNLSLNRIPVPLRLRQCEDQANRSGPPSRRRLAPPVSNTLRHEPQDSNWMRTVPVSQSLVLCPIGEKPTLLISMLSQSALTRLGAVQAERPFSFCSSRSFQRAHINRIPKLHLTAKTLS